MCKQLIQKKTHIPMYLSWSASAGLLQVERLVLSWCVPRLFRDECSLWTSAGRRVLRPLAVANNLVSN
jgi:hypothetical protein